MLPPSEAHLEVPDRHHSCVHGRTGGGRYPRPRLQLRRALPRRGPRRARSQGSVCLVNEPCPGGGVGGGGGCRGSPCARGARGQRCPKGSLAVTHPRGCLPLKAVRQDSPPTSRRQGAPAASWPRCSTRPDQVRLDGRDRDARAAFDRSATGVGDRLIAAVEHGPPIDTSTLTAQAANEEPRATRQAHASDHDRPAQSLRRRRPEAGGTGTTLAPSASQTGSGMRRPRAGDRVHAGACTKSSVRRSESAEFRHAENLIQSGGRLKRLRLGRHVRSHRPQRDQISLRWQQRPIRAHVCTQPSAVWTHLGPPSVAQSRPACRHL